MIEVCMLVTNRGIDDVRVCMEAHALAATGRYHVSVIGWDRQIDEDITERHGDVDFYRLKLRSTHSRGLTQAFFLLRFWRRAAGLAASLRPQVVHCHDFDTLPAGLRIARRLGARIVFDAHENYPDMMDGHLPATAVWWLRRMERRLVRRVDLLVTVGRRLADHYRRLGAPAVAVVGNWKNAREYSFAPSQVEGARNRMGLDARIAIAFIANLGRERHLEQLLTAVSQDRRFCCVVGGRGVLENAAAEFAARNDNIIYLGHVRPTEVPLLTAACDVIYYGFDKGNPNSRWSAPNKLYEAIAAGKPLLAGDFGEVGPTVTEGEFGVLCDTADASAISAALEQLARPEAISRMGAAARALQARYSATAACSALESAYTRLCQHLPAAAAAEALT